MEDTLKLVLVLAALASITVVMPMPKATSCKEGEYLPINETICRQCDTQCPGNQIILKNCTKHEDIKCGCPSGKYFKLLTHGCEWCKVAQPGEIYIRRCSVDEDAHVEKCPKGTFTVDNKNCMNCTTCSSTKVECTSSSDAVCKGNGGTNSSIAVAITCGILIPLGLIALGFVIYRRRRSQNPANNNVPHEGNVEGSYNQSVNSLTERSHEEGDDRLNDLQQVKGASRTRIPNGYQRASSQISQSSITNGNVEHLTEKDGPSVVNFTASDLTVRWEKTDMAKLSYNHRLELAKLLAPSSLKDWKSLAGELGFDCVEIRNLAMQKGYDCVMKMFEAYECMEYASIQHLYDKLISIQRHDAAKVLEPYKSK